MYLEVCDHEVPLAMSPVMQATEHTRVQLHLMLTLACSGEPLPTHCSTEFTAAGLWRTLRCREPRARQQLLRRVPP